MKNSKPTLYVDISTLIFSTFLDCSFVYDDDLILEFAESCYTFAKEFSIDGSSNDGPCAFWCQPCYVRWDQNTSYIKLN